MTATCNNYAEALFMLAREENLIDEFYKAMVTKSLGVDAIMIFLSYIAYLWVDDIETKEKNKKSIDNSLDWFWKKV